MQAASWLGISNPEELLRTEGTGFAAPRPEGLGLGAKFLPHHKVRTASSDAHRAYRWDKQNGMLAGKSSYSASGEEARQEVAPTGGWIQAGRHRTLPAQEALEQSVTPGVTHCRSSMCSSCCEKLTILLPLVDVCNQS